MKDQSPIPIPFKQRWQDFKTEYLPILIFVVLCACIVWMWGKYVTPSTAIGQVETINANVISIAPGTVQELRTDLLQRVTNGQCLAVLRVMEPDVLTNELAAIEASMHVLKARMDVDKLRNVNLYAQTRRDLISEKLNLALAQIREIQADSELTRSKALFDAKLITAGATSAKAGTVGYEVALRDRDALRAEIDQRTHLVEQLEKDLKQLESSSEIAITPTDDSIEKNIEAQIRRFQSLNRCVSLNAPIDGFVSAVNHRVGEKVMAGLPVLVVSAQKSERVIAWMRQPISVMPKVGDVVKIRRPFMGQAGITGTVSQVGGQLQPISPVLLPPSSAQATILGLPFTITLPPNAHFTPGEPVAVTFPKPPGSLF